MEYYYYLLLLLLLLLLLCCYISFLWNHLRIQEVPYIHDKVNSWYIIIIIIIIITYLLT